MKSKIFLLLTLILIIFLGTTLYGSTLDKLEKQLEALDQERENTEAALEDLKDNAKRLNQELQNLDQSMNTLNGDIQILESKLEEKGLEIVASQFDIETLLQEEAKAYEVSKERIKIMYEYGSTGFLSVLFEAHDLADFFNRAEYINRIVEFDINIMKELRRIELELIAKHESLETQKLELDALVIEAELKLQEMESLVRAKNKDMDIIENNRELYLEKMAWLEEQEALIDKAIKEEIAKSKLVYAGGKFSWPVPGWYNINSKFGPRLHPIFKVWRNHDGVDIPASYGVDIQAAASGKVLIAGWGNGYGNYVVIDHGSGYATLYAHCSSLLVEKGEAVTRHQKIAKIGSTGWSTGNHLHFGIQLNGNWIDPEPLLKAQ